MTGKLYIVGVGPGHHDHMTFRAKEVITESDTIVGYETYVNLVQDLIGGKTIHRYAMTQEVERAHQCIDLAKSGKIDDLILNQAIENFEIESYGKSLDIKDFDISFARGLSLEDGCATITNFTAYLIAKGIEYTNDKNDKLNKYLICGGGRKNSFLIQSIKKIETILKNNLEMVIVLNILK